MRWRSVPVSLLVSVLAIGLLVSCATDEGAGGASGERAAIEIEVAVDKPIATTGDLITYAVTVRHDEGWEVEVPEVGDALGGLEVVDRRAEPARSRRGRQIVDHWYVLRADLIGSYSLPEVTVEGRRDDEGGSKLTSSATSDAIVVEVESVLPADGTASDIRDIKPLREIRIREWRPWAAGLLGAALLAAAAYWWWRRSLRPAPLEPPIPPHELALQRLEDLYYGQLDDLAAVRRYYFAISSVVRAYVEGRFELNATDLTTEEIVERLADIVDLDAGESTELVTFLRDTDAVKYAARTPSDDDVERIYQEAWRFVETTRPSEPDEEAAA